MSFYNLVHGENILASGLLAALGLNRSDVPRYRDCWWDGTFICVHTRTGGGNREGYQKENDALTVVDGYDHDDDDSFDSTYATFYFRPSAALKEALSAVQVQDATPEQRWKGFFDKLYSQTEDAQTERVADAMKPIFDAIQAQAAGTPARRDAE